MEPIKATTADTATEAADTAVAITYAANPNGRHVCSQIVASYSGAPTGGSVKIEDGAGTTIFESHIHAAGPHSLAFSPPISGSYNTAMIITLAAGGASVVGELNVRHFTF